MWGICLKSYEKESFLKSFVLFFSVQMLLLSIVMWQHYHKVLHEYDMQIGNAMMQCYLDGVCDRFQGSVMESIPSKQRHRLYTDDGIYMLFQTDDHSLMKIALPIEQYNNKQQQIKKRVWYWLLLYSSAVFLISVLFALYAIRPLKKALALNEEFVKDILHDFNTPLAALNINYKILQKKYGDDEALQRSHNAIKEILALQTNLHFFLNQSKLSSDTLPLKALLEERTTYFQTLFPSLTFQVNVGKVLLFTNTNAFVRILDNLLSNAGKYNNSENGFIKITLKHNILHIEDNAEGIQHPEKIFERYYKEGENGTGLGLHIVKKLCDELGIEIRLKTTVGKGSTFMLDLSSIVHAK